MSLCPTFLTASFFWEKTHILDFRDVQNELQAILNQLGSDKIRGLIIGRFQKETGMTRELLTKIIKSKKELEGVPVVGNIDFGHTIPMVYLSHRRNYQA